MHNIIHNIYIITKWNKNPAFFQEILLEILEILLKKGLTQEKNRTIIKIRQEMILSAVQQIRACTGFDGDSEVEEAIRGTGPRSKP